ncbi:phage tail tape measure protein [Labrys sp. KNU-23]|uniref:phage tail tape measure protein n=1 Tax=Labrys sp. KNU-23 TaxID=2789216 RepID=UPI0011EDA561|nr:phage tail tape measure protein [Labrys sp. KNU-23]QEN87728.1 phage tail tape measure protein [Labrys sp. KNU-23]
MKILEAQVQISAMDRTAGAFDAVAAKAKALDKALKENQGGTGVAEQQQAPKGERMDTSRAVAAGGVIAGAALKFEQAYASFDRRITLLGNTFGATPQQTAAMIAGARGTSQKYGVPMDDTVGAMEALSAQGLNFDQIMGKLETIIKAANTSGSRPEEIARTAGGLSQNMRISDADLPRAFDILYRAGLAGQFELKDMAQYLPGIASAAAPKGLIGLEGVERLAAYLETLRGGTGDAATAINRLENLFQKLDDDASQKRFLEDGIDNQGDVKRTNEAGGDQLATMLGNLRKGTAGDSSRIREYFKDAQVLFGAQILQDQKARFDSFLNEFRGAGGDIDRDAPKLMNDAYANNQRVSNEMSFAMVEAGSTLWKGFENFREWANGWGEDIRARHDMTEPQKSYVYQSRDLMDLQEQLGAWQARAREKRAEAANGGIFTRGFAGAEADRADAKVSEIAQKIVDAMERRRQLGPLATHEDPWEASPLNKKGGGLLSTLDEIARNLLQGKGQTQPQAPVDVTGKVQLDPASKVAVDVRVKVDGGTVTAMSTNAGGNAKANVGVSMAQGSPGHTSRRDE